jgi:hypothetical protein
VEKVIACETHQNLNLYFVIACSFWFMRSKDYIDMIYKTSDTSPNPYHANACYFGLPGLWIFF